MLTDAAKATVAGAEKQRSAYLRNEGPLFDSRLGARTIGDMALVEPGCEIWAREHGDIENVRLNRYLEARGGIVLEVVDKTTVDEDGEITRHRAFRCFDCYSRLPLWDAFVTLTEAQVDPDRFDMPEPARLSRTVRRFAAEIAKGKSVLTRREAQLVLDADRLAAILMQGHA